MAGAGRRSWWWASTDLEWWWNWRRTANEAGASNDCWGFIFGAVGCTLLFIAKTWLREGLPVLALQASTFSALLAAQALLTRHKSGRGMYARYRELFVLASACHLQWVVRLTALHGAVNTIDHHNGPISLLLLLAGHTTALYIGLYMVFARLVWPASLAVLGITAAGSLLNGQRMCVRVLESPGVAGQLEGLHQILSLLHRGMMPPGPADLLAAGVTSPMAQCKVVSSWLVIVLGLALPAAVLWHLERQWRAAGQRQQRQQQQRQELPASEAAVDETARWRAGASAYLFSATTWLVACAAYGDTL